MSLKRKLKHCLEILVAVLKEKNEIPIIVEKREVNLLEGKVALITGGSGGIGLAIAKKFSECGCKVIISGTNEEKLRDCSNQIAGSKTIVINYNDVGSFEEKILEASKFFGKIDILVSSSGIHTDYAGFDWDKITEKDYDFVMDINLKGTYFMIQKFAKYLINTKQHGHILVVSSQSALEPSWSPYRLSKLGMRGITEGLAQKLLPYGIIVNAIGPGPTATAMQDYQNGKSIYTADNPIGRYTMPEEVAEFAKLMVSDLGNTIVGDTLYMSGGRGII